MTNRDPMLLAMMGVVLGLLLVASLVTLALGRRAVDEAARASVADLRSRVFSSWWMCLVFSLALLAGKVMTVVLFAIISFRALREFITLTPTRRGDHRALFWVFFILTPLQYVMVGMDWYGLYSVLIPVYGFLFVAIRSAAAGESEGFLERAAKIQWGLMICVYCLSYAPALLNLEIRGYDGRGATLLFWLVLVTEVSDVLQYAWGRCCGRHKIAPVISPNKTWEGFLGGVACTTLMGAALWKATPFAPWEAAGMALGVALMGFAGGLVMSAIKRDRGVKDYGSFIGGHGGMLDRMDSLCFAAPVFFHLTQMHFG